MRLHSKSYKQQSRARQKSQSGRTQKKIGIIKDSYRNKDIEIEFGFTGKGLNKSLFSQMSYGGSYADLAKVFSVMNDVVSNAELIEVHDDYKKKNTL